MYAHICENVSGLRGIFLYLSVRSYPHTLLYVVLINQVYDHFYHDILFFRPTLSYHQREGDKGAVGDALSAVLTVKNAVIVRFRAPFLAMAEFKRA